VGSEAVERYRGPRDLPSLDNFIAKQQGKVIVIPTVNKHSKKGKKINKKLNRHFPRLLGKRA